MKLGTVVSDDAMGAMGVLLSAKINKVAGMRITRNIKKLEPAMEAYREARTALYAELGGERNEEGSEVKKPRQPEFNKRLKELHDDELEITVEQINASHLPDDIEPIVFLALDWMIYDDITDDQPASAA